MSIDELSVETLTRLKASRWDRIIEKHEGPETWKRQLERREKQPDDIIFQMEPDYDPVAATPEFMLIGENQVLLPVGREHHPNITILHHFLSEDRAKLVIYLKDVTYDDSLFGAGYVTICDRQPEGFYLTTLYHEWFIIDYDPEAKARFGN